MWFVFEPAVNTVLISVIQQILSSLNLSSCEETEATYRLSRFSKCPHLMSGIWYVFNKC
jgi:hypothetical protein